MGRIRLDMISTSGVRRSFPIADRGCLIGRSHRSDVRIALPTIAARHAEIVREKDRFVLKPGTPDAVTVINGDPVPRGGRALAQGDLLEIGPVGFRIVEIEVAAEVEVKAPPPSGPFPGGEAPEPAAARDSRDGSH